LPRRKTGVRTRLRAARNEPNELKEPDVPTVLNEPDGGNMSVARVTEITASSKKSFDDALKVGIDRATKTLKNVEGAWIQDQKVVIKGGKITEYRVNMKVTFILAE
jgi:flavin-binding protein dodecin